MHHASARRAVHSSFVVAASPHNITALSLQSPAPRLRDEAARFALLPDSAALHPAANLQSLATLLSEAEVGTTVPNSSGGLPISIPESGGHVPQWCSRALGEHGSGHCQQGIVDRA